jgi:Tfp pilus assembly protein PilZ
MSFTDDNFLPSATALMLEVNILSRVLCFIGKVAWASPLPHSDRYRIGVGFEEAAQPDKDFLSDYIDMQLGRIL